MAASDTMTTKGDISMLHRASRAFQVLLVEDDPGDAGLIRNALMDERIGSFEGTWGTSLVGAW